MLEFHLHWQTSFNFIDNLLKLQKDLDKRYKLSAIIIQLDHIWPVDVTIFCLLCWKRKDNLASGTMLKYMKRQFMDPFTLAFSTTWSKSIDPLVLEFFLPCILFLFGDYWFCWCYMQVQPCKWWNCVHIIFRWNHQLYWLGDWFTSSFDGP